MSDTPVCPAMHSVPQFLCRYGLWLVSCGWVVLIGASGQIGVSSRIVGVFVGGKRQALFHSRMLVYLPLTMFNVILQTKSCNQA